jgi:hypothetical protein
MKFLLDMGLARSTADFLRAQRYDSINEQAIRVRPLSIILRQQPPT